MDADQRARYQEYRSRLNAREVLARYGARNCSEITNRDGTTEIVHSCLLDRVEPHHRNGDEHPSAWCNVDKNLYVCASYWSGDLLALVAKLEGKEHISDVLPVVGEMLSGSTKGVVELADEITRLLHAHEVAEVPIPVYDRLALKSWAMTHPYMRDWRGISQATQEFLSIGYDPRENRIVIPHFWRGGLVGWQKRAIPSQGWSQQAQRYETAAPWPPTANQHPKYRSSLGFPKSETLYGYDQAMETAGLTTAIVVESPMSVIKAFELLKPGVLATFGAKVSRTQVDLLKVFDCVYVWFDADPAGYTGARKLVEPLMNHTQVMVVPPADGVDLGDYTSCEAVTATLGSAIPAALWLAS